MKLRFRNMPSFRVKVTAVAPAWIWPQGCSMRQRATAVGAMSCDALKNAALPRQALVMLVATVVPPIVVVPVAPPGVGVVSAVHEAMLGIWLVSVKKAPNGPA